MDKTDIDKIKVQLNKVLSFVDPAYINALLSLAEMLDNEHIEWAVGGELGEALETVQVEPDCIEIVTSKEGAKKIFSVVTVYNPEAIDFLTSKLLINANINGSELPIYVRSYFFEFFLDCVKIKVHGDIQYKINDWDWGDKLEFNPEYVNVTGVIIAVVPLGVKHEIYQNLGWIDRAEKVDSAIKRRRQIAR